MRKVFILRGLPGAGKSRWLKERVLQLRGKSLASVSADQYHYSPVTQNEDGTLKAPVYNFKPENAKHAHDSCLREFLDLILQPLWDEVIVDNTNTSAWEIAPYYRLAEVMGYEAEIIWLQCSVATSVARNVHSVPENTIEKMAERLESESLPPWWKQTIITEGY